MYYTLTQHDDKKDGPWKGFRGRVTFDMIKKSDFPLPTDVDEDDILITSFGPKGFSEHINGILETNGYRKQMDYW